MKIILQPFSLFTNEYINNIYSIIELDKKISVLSVTISVVMG